MTTIRKTISISKKDEKLQEVLKEVPSYEVSHVIRQLMYDGLKYRALVENGIVNDFGFNPSHMPIVKDKKEPKSTNITPKKEIKEEKIEEIDEEFDLNSIKLEQIKEEDEDLEDLLLNNG